MYYNIYQLVPNGLTFIDWINYDKTRITPLPIPVVWHVTLSVIFQLLKEELLIAMHGRIHVAWIDGCTKSNSWYFVWSHYKISIKITKIPILLLVHYITKL